MPTPLSVRTSTQSSLLAIFSLILQFLLISPAARASDETCNKASDNIFASVAEDAKIKNGIQRALGESTENPEAIHESVDAIKAGASEMVDGIAASCKNGNCDEETLIKNSETWFRKSVLNRVAAVKGSYMRKFPVCMDNFKRNIRMILAFQVIGYGLEYWRKHAAGEKTPEVPFGIFGNTILLVWTQNEIMCRESQGNLARAAGSANTTGRGYWADSWKRYKELMVLMLPFGAVSYTFFATAEHKIRREIEVAKDGSSDRVPVISRDYLKHVLEHVVFIGIFETVLFARLAWSDAIFEYTWLPALRNHLSRHGLGVVSTGVDTLYRLTKEVSGSWGLMWWKGVSNKYFKEFFEKNPPEEHVEMQELGEEEHSEDYFKSLEAL